MRFFRVNFKIIAVDAVDAAVWSRDLQFSASGESFA